MTRLRRLRLALALALAVPAGAAAYAWAAGGIVTTPLGGVSVTRVGTSSAVVTWQVKDVPAHVSVEYGVDGRYGVWSTATEALSPQAGSTTLTGLEPNTVYTYHAVSVSPFVRAEAAGTFRTAPVPASPAAGIAAATVAAGTAALFASSPTAPTVANLTVDGSPIFPRMVWRQCPYAYAESLAAGINLFLGTSCTTPGGQLQALAGKAFSALDIARRNVSGPGLLGWHLPDEGDESIGRADGLPNVHGGGRVTFLTLTDHFAPYMAPPTAGRSIYPGWFARADMIGFDTYPIEGRCRWDMIPTVYTLQKTLVQMAGTKPTFQWIEAGPMEKCFRTDPTPQSVRAEAWLSIAAGARGIGYFPDVWSDTMRAAITSVNADIVSLAPALLDTPGTGIVGPTSPIRVGVRKHNGATYVIAVNSSTSPVTGRMAVPALGDRTLTVFGENRTVSSQLSQIVDSFPGLGVHIYIAPPPGW
jgi:hypothetical protein